MHPIHDIDVVVLMATTLSAKRRPAELIEIVAALDLLQGYIPNEDRLVDAFRRLSAQGLVNGESGFALTPAAEAIMATLPRKCDTAERIVRIKTELADYRPAEEFAAIELAEVDVGAAIQAHRAAQALAAKNLPAPNPRAAAKDDKHDKRPGEWRKFGDSRRRRS